MASRRQTAIGVRTLSLRLFRETRCRTSRAVQSEPLDPGEVCPAPDIACWDPAAVGESKRGDDSKHEAADVGEERHAATVAPALNKPKLPSTSW